MKNTVRYFYLMILLTLMVLSIGHTVQAQSIRSILMEKELTVCVHRAAVNPDVTENSIAGMELAKNEGFIMLEIDLRESRDGEIFLMHDETLDRTTTATGAVSDYTAGELRDINLKGSGEPVPGLPKALEWARENEILLMLDVKDTPLEKVYEDVLEADMLDQIFLITFLEEQSKEALSLDPALMVSVLITSPEDIQKYQDYAQDPNQLMAYINRRADPELFKKVRQSGITVITDTLREIDARALEEGQHIYLEFISKRKPDIVVSDYPIKVRGVLP